MSAQLDLAAEVINEPDAALLGSVAVDHDLGNRVVPGHQPEVFGVNLAVSHAVRLPSPGPVTPISGTTDRRSGMVQPGDSEQLADRPRCAELVRRACVELSRHGSCGISQGRRSITSFDDLEMGDYQSILGNPDRWKQLGWPLHRATFIERLNELRLTRNDVMHFNPEPLPPNTVEKLRNMLKVLRGFGPDQSLTWLLGSLCATRQLPRPCRLANPSVKIRAEGHDCQGCGLEVRDCAAVASCACTRTEGSARLRPGNPLTTTERKQHAR